MSVSSRPVSPRAAGLVIAVFLIGLVVVWLAFFRSPTAAPGNQPAALRPGEKAPPLSPEDGIVAPHLTTAEMEKIKKGETVIRAMPGGGHLKIGPAKKENK
jgi:hypothetical protein